MADPFQSGLAAHRAGQLVEAEAAYRAVLARNKTHADALHFLGLLKMQSGKMASAESLIRRALAQREDANILNNLGILLHRSDRLAEAEAAYRRALGLSSGQADIHSNLANVLRRRGRPPSDIEAECRRALDCKPGHAEALNLLGLLMLERGETEDAASAFLAVIASRANHVEAHLNLGVARERQGRLLDAEACLRQALAADPDHVAVLINIGVLLRKTNRLAEAEPMLRRALGVDPGNVSARTSLSYVLLGLGRYAEAWPLYESRHAAGQGSAPEARPTLLCPQWQGESLAGRSLVLWPEQGFGDLIQFSRFGTLLKALGLHRLTLVCDPAIAPLLQSLDGVDAVVTDPDRLAPHDYWSFMASIPHRLATTLDSVPNALPYLHAEAAHIEHWRPRLPEAGLRVGLVWQGSPAHTNDADRSLPTIGVLAPLWSVAGTSFVSLQKGQGEEDARRWAAGHPLTLLGPDMRDFADMAAIVAQLDLVVCVDTAIAHLAGALGKRCWVLLPAFGLDWRWLQDRDDSPWYPGRLRLFRQAERGDWSRTADDLAAALSAWPA